MPDVQVSEEENGLMAAIKRALPCQCIDAYKGRRLTDPDCPRCNYAEAVALEIIDWLTATLPVPEAQTVRAEVTDAKE
jgi:hypothetical protein